ncbi:hypothetical protein AXG93_2189s1070 [Marchantia polymorpha subsp. ruderalis]|uniref:Uncharacterized protein n=3 Tax=Marchantia polymorpha TaxID=3197 RepID=A0A176WSF2_MARPO|nr:hypothetical protein AXG93_2189s1070 [Marchantia polymorpha subsp. ruderalis]
MSPRPTGAGDNTMELIESEQSRTGVTWCSQIGPSPTLRLSDQNSSLNFAFTNSNFQLKLKFGQISDTMASQMSACFFIAMVVLGVATAQAQGPAVAPATAPSVSFTPTVAPVASPPSATVPTVAPVVAPAVAPTTPTAPITTPTVAPTTPPPTATPVVSPPTATPISAPTVSPISSPPAVSAIAPGPVDQDNAGAMTSPFAWTGLVVASALVAALAY